MRGRPKLIRQHIKMVSPHENGYGFGCGVSGSVISLKYEPSSLTEGTASWINISPKREICTRTSANRPEQHTIRSISTRATISPEIMLVLHLSDLIQNCTIEVFVRILIDPRHVRRLACQRRPEDSPPIEPQRHSALIRRFTCVCITSHAVNANTSGFFEFAPGSTESCRIWMNYAQNVRLTVMAG